MDFEYSSEQKILRESAHKLMAKECTSEHVREMVDDEKGYSEKLWEKMAELGWMSLLVPEEYNGSGVSFLDLSVILSEMGYYCLQGPFFSTVVLGGLTVLEAGNESQKVEILSALADGKHLLTMACTEADTASSPESIKTTAELNGDEVVLSGTKLFVPYAHVAQTIICAARTSDSKEGISLFLVDPQTEGLVIKPLDTLAGDKQFEVVFDNVRIPRKNMLGELDGGWKVLQDVFLKAAVAKCAEMAGGADKVMELVVPYVKGRKQFGKPVAAFQAVQHHCSDMLTYADSIKLLTHQTAWKISQGLPFALDASMCKAWGSDSFRKLVAFGHQVVGGFGFMEEYDLQLYFKQAKTAELWMGDADYHRECVAAEMGM
jgi:3-oxocholest-4-en-26-oyl-CoA dehydrogenase beta subunit